MTGGTVFVSRYVAHYLAQKGDDVYVLNRNSNPHPFTEEQKCGPNAVWASTVPISWQRRNICGSQFPRPPYLYGPMQNVYREPFAFECSESSRKFYIPGDGRMKLQFFHVEDLCRFIEILLEKHPEERVYNVGSPNAETISEWVKLCYNVVGANLETVQVEGHPQRAYFCFHDYDYYLDVTKQTALMPDVKPLAEGLKESYEWFRQHRERVMRRPYWEYVEENLK